MTKGPDNEPTLFSINSIYISRTISVVMLLISFLTFWSLAIDSIEQRDKSHYLTRASTVPIIGPNQLMTWK
jgi:hypothetical protein